MARKPNYSFERHERDRAKALKLAEKAEAKRQLRARGSADDSAPATDMESGPSTPSLPDEA